MTDARRLLVLFTAAAIGAVVIAGCPSSETPEAEAPTTSTLPETEAQPIVPENIGNAKNADGDYICPVMGNVVNDFSDDNSVEHQGKEYFFCCEECVAKFKADPDKYVAKIESGDMEVASPEDAEHYESSGHGQDIQHDEHDRHDRH